MRNVYLEFHARVITKIQIKGTHPPSFSIKTAPLPILNQYSENACVTISTCIALYLLSEGNIWINPKEIYSTLSNSTDGLSFIEVFLYLLDNYKYIFTNYSIRRMNINVSNIKTSLSLGFPLLFGYTVDKQIKDFHFSGNTHMPLIKTPGKIIEGHAVCCIGFTETHFIIVNSWGTTFGEGGVYYMPIENIHLITDVYAITPSNFSSFSY